MLEGPPAGFVTKGHNTCMLDMYELGLSQAPQRGTGRVVPKVILSEAHPNCNHDACGEGGHVWADGHRS